MNEALWMISFLMLLYVFRAQMRRYQWQAYLHRHFPKLTPFLQHYSLLSGFLLLFLLGYYLGIIFFGGFSTKSSEDLTSSLNATLHEASELGPSEIEAWLESLWVPPWLNFLATRSPYSVLLTCFVSFGHVLSLITENSDSNGVALKWFPTLNQDWSLQILLLPAFYATLSFHSVVRMWAVVVGEGWSASLLQSGLTWEDAAEVHVEHYDANFAVANCAEMYTLLKFSHLCLSVLENRRSDKSNDLERPFRTLIMLGLNGFIIVGFVKVACELWMCAIVQNHHGAAAEEELEPLEVHFRGGAGQDGQAAQLFSSQVSIDATPLQILIMVLHGIFVLASMQGLHTIWNVCGIDELAAGNARWKFFGTMFLVMCAQLQYAGLRIVALALDEVNEFQARLLHASLLCYECLVVSVLNAWNWTPEDYCENSWMGRSNTKLSLAERLEEMETDNDGSESRPMTILRQSVASVFQSLLHIAPMPSEAISHA